MAGGAFNGLGFADRLLEPCGELAHLKNFEGSSGGEPHVSPDAIDRCFPHIKQAFARHGERLESSSTIFHRR